MKIYKVYAQCCRVPNAIKEIDISEARNLIVDTVDSMINNEDIVLSIDSNDGDMISVAYEDLYDKAIAFFEENNFFWCGDFAIICSDEEPSRSGSYGWTREFL